MLPADVRTVRGPSRPSSTLTLVLAPGVQCRGGVRTGLETREENHLQSWTPKSSDRSELLVAVTHVKIVCVDTNYYRSYP